MRPLNAAIDVSTKPGFVQRVGMDRDLRIGARRRRVSAAIDRGRRGAPVLVQLEADRAGRRSARSSGCGQARVALAEKAEIHRDRHRPACSIRARCHGPGVHVVANVPVAGPVPPPIIVVTPEHQRFVDLLRADEVDVRIDAARSDDHALAGDDFGAGADRRWSRPAARPDCRLCRCALIRPSLIADVGLDDAPVVDDHRVGDDRVGDIGARRAGSAPCRRGSPCRRRT